MLEGLRGEDSVAELCRREGINQNLYYRWSKEFLEAVKTWRCLRSHHQLSKLVEGDKFNDGIEASSDQTHAAA